MRTDDKTVFVSCWVTPNPPSVPLTDLSRQHPERAREFIILYSMLAAIAHRTFGETPVADMNVLSFTGTPDYFTPRLGKIVWTGIGDATADERVPQCHPSDRQIAVAQLRLLAALAEKITGEKPEIEFLATSSGQNVHSPIAPKDGDLLADEIQWVKRG